MSSPLLSAESEVDRLLREEEEAAAAHYAKKREASRRYYAANPDKCKACMTCFKKCPAGAIIGGKNKIHIVDQEKCTKCGTCFEVCPPKFRAITKISGVPVPPPVPEEQRTIVRGGKKDE